MMIDVNQQNLTATVYMKKNKFLSADVNLLLEYNLNGNRVNAWTIIAMFQRGRGELQYAADRQSGTVCTEKVCV